MLVGIISKNWLKSLVKGEEGARVEPGMEDVLLATATHDDDTVDVEEIGVVAAVTVAGADDSTEEEEDDEVSEEVLVKPEVDPLVGIDDPLAPAYDLEDGELFNEDDFLEEQKTTLPWSSRVQNAKDFFATEILYRFDILEAEARRAIAGNYRFEIKGYQGGVWTLGVGDELSVVNRREDADIVLTMYQRDFLQLVNGELNPQLAILAQKLRVQGDIRRAMAFQDIILPQRDN